MHQHHVLRSATSAIRRTMLGWGTVSVVALTFSPLLLSSADAANAAPSATEQSEQHSSSWHVAQQAAVADGVYELVWSPSLKALFAAAANGFENERGGTVYRLDPQTLKIEQQWTLPHKAFGLTFDERTPTLFVGHTLDQAISALNVDSGAIKTLQLVEPTPEPVEGEEKPFGPNPREMTLDPVTETLYISGVGDDSVVWAIDAKTLTLKKTLPDFGVWATGIVVDSAAQRLYVSTYKDSSVRVVDTSSGEIVARWAAGGENPLNLALDAKGHRLFVTHAKSDTVSVIDTRSGKIMHQLDAGASSLAVKFDAHAQRLYVTQRDAHRVMIFDTENYRRVGEQMFETMPNSLAFDPDNATVWVSLKQPLDDKYQSKAPDGIARLVP
ncbi:YncE family protein [Phytohalomonas tamaricis]|uniref:YncE family protein n=1 Tax=Phytohalomonas tamaricis TaxID=2081032 RepID=UPI000D0BBED1|nr:YncE family protein [Phytohalomonas tamaricis]